VTQLGVLAACVLGSWLLAAPGHAAVTGRPNVLIVTIDTLRADHMSGYGYERPTSPNLDRLMARGVRFDQARTVEPLTAPALVSMLTSLHPHEHGTSRNGLRMHEDLDSLPRMLAAAGYRTAAFVGNWTLRDKVTGLGLHFEEYQEILRRKRYLALFGGETPAQDLTREALGWLADHAQHGGARPFLLWVHYVDPHAPYKLHAEHRRALGIGGQGKPTARDRYDTEIAEVDRRVGELLAGLAGIVPEERTLIAFASDHGESLGEHDYWGHGRHLFETTLRVPMALVWPGRLRPGVIDAPALNIDLAPTIASLLGLAPPPEFRGFDWKPVADGVAPAPFDRVTHHQAHRGAVLSLQDSELARRAGLLEVAVVQDRLKQLLRLKNGRILRYDLRRDPQEREDVSEPQATRQLAAWQEAVVRELGRSDAMPPAPLDAETAEQLRALGYAD
jgi:arylsulfatase A-like enzyme